MKKITVILILLIASIFTTAQTDNFSLLLQQKSSDSVLVQKLKAFSQNGIELSLNLDSISPQQFIDTAKTYIGTPHCMGGISHSCIDCSGLLYASFKSLGINISRSSQDLARYGDIILEIDSLKTGDLIFFVNTYKTTKTITHSGIYIGDYQFIHTSSSRGVVISNIQGSYYLKHYIFSTRIFK